MRSLWMALAGLLAAVLVWVGIVDGYFEGAALQPSARPGAMRPLAVDRTLNTVNTTRIGSDDPVETAVAVAQIIYPVTEDENAPGAVVLINRSQLAEGMAAASRVQHFPVNAPLLYVDENSIPPLTRGELPRLKPEGVPMDGNTQVYLVGTISDAVRREVEGLGYRVRVLRAPDPVALTEVLDDWSSTQHGDHPNVVVVVNLDRLLLGLPSAFWNAHMGDGLEFVTDQGIPDATRRILARRANGPWLYLFGDETVIPASIARELATYGQVTRMPKRELPDISAYFSGFKDLGANWGAWYVQDARDFGWGISEAGHNAIFANVDGPGGWQNALPATTLSHMGKHAPVLFVSRDAVPEAVANYLSILKPYPTAPEQQLLNHGWIIGGEGTISWPTQAALDLMLEGQMATGAGR